VPCARLSWPYRQLLSAHKYTVSYHIFLLYTSLRPNSCSSDSRTNSPKYTTLHLGGPTLLETLALSLTNILLSLTKLHLSPKPVTVTFVSFVVSGLISIPQLPVPSLPLSFSPNLTNVILVVFRLNMTSNRMLL